MLHDLVVRKIKKLEFWHILQKKLKLGKLKTRFWYSKNGKCTFCFNGQSLVKKWQCCGSENDFFKKLGARLIRAKGQTHPGSNEIGMSLCKIQKITLKVCAMKKSWYMYPRWSIIHVGCCALLSVSRFGSCLTKNRFRHSENGKHTFYGTKRISAFVEFLAIPRATRMSDIALFRQTMPWSGPNLTHLT
jgi:hypothetical protein